MSKRTAAVSLSLAAVLCALPASFALAADETADRTIVYDFASKQLGFEEPTEQKEEPADRKTEPKKERVTRDSRRRLLRVRSGTRVNVKIININTFLYDATARLENRSFHTDPPPVFRQNLLPQEPSSAETTLHLQPASSRARRSGSCSMRSRFAETSSTARSRLIPVKAAAPLTGVR